jgi:hypothetical protein
MGCTSVMHCERREKVRDVLIERDELRLEQEELVKLCKEGWDIAWGKPYRGAERDTALRDNAYKVWLATILLRLKKDVG